MNNRTMTVVIVADTVKAFVVSHEPTVPAHLQPGEQWLAPGDMLRLPRTGQTLRIVAGRAWITFGGQDVILQAGQQILLQPGTDVALVAALENEPVVYRMSEDH